MATGGRRGGRHRERRESIRRHVQWSHCELADAVGLELLESEAVDDEDELMEDDLPPVQGIPEAAWECLRGLRESKHAPTGERLGGET